MDHEKRTELLIQNHEVELGGGDAHLEIPTLGRQRQVDLCEFKASLIYRASSRTGRATQRNPASKSQNK